MGWCVCVRACITVQGLQGMQASESYPSYFLRTECEPPVVAVPPFLLFSSFHHTSHTSTFLRPQHSLLDCNSHLHLAPISIASPIASRIAILMFIRLAKRAHSPAEALKAGIRHQRFSPASARPAYAYASVRFQSSSSSSRDNDNSSNSDLDPITSNEVPVNAALELHRVDLAHGSFFALHRPLLGIANGPMFANNNHHNMMDEDYEDPVDDLAHYFSTLKPYTPPSPLSQPALVTPSATTWASLPPTIPDAGQAVDDFLRHIEDQQQQQQWMQQKQDEESRASSASTIVAESIVAGSPLENTNAMHLTSVLRKRKIKMRKHKYKKLRKRTRALRKKLGK